VSNTIKSPADASTNAKPEPDSFDDLAAEVRAEIRARINRPNIEFDDVITAARANLDQLIDKLIPVSKRGKTKGDELWSCNPTRVDMIPDSFSINTKTGEWHDFSNKDGGNIFTLWKLVNGLASNADAMFAIAKFIGVSERGPVVIKKTELGPIVEKYDYTDRDGKLLYQVTRHEPKTFRQRQPNGRGGWIPNLDGVKRVIYRLPEVEMYPDASVFLCEGEKDADRVASLSHCATTIAGDGKWTTDCVNALAGRNVFILEDNDVAGRNKSLAAATALHGIATSIRIVQLPSLAEKGDVSDWLNADAANTGRLVDVCVNSTEWYPTAAPQD
jgi:hypothetical protein